jgi:hypothetical protein
MVVGLSLMVGIQYFLSLSLICFFSSDFSFMSLICLSRFISHQFFFCYPTKMPLVFSYLFKLNDHLNRHGKPLCSVYTWLNIRKQ